MGTRALIVGVGAVGWVALCAPLAGGQTTGPVTVPFTTPGTSSYTVPAGICRVTVDARGAAGGNANVVVPSSQRAAIQARLAAAGKGPANPPAGFVHAAADTGSGGLGGETTATIPVTSGETLTVSVGGAGQDIGSSLPDGGTPDGGSGGIGALPGAGGGGSSDVRQGGTGLANRVVVAGGGGGAGAAFVLSPVPFAFEDGGGGGGLTGQHGSPSSSATDAGGGGTQTAGGAAGAGAPFGTDGVAGSLGHGGTGASEVLAVAGAGGGGGLFGGGGGAAALLGLAAFGSAGGGGSGFGPPSATFQTAVNSGNGSVRITSDPANSGCVAAAAVVQPRFTG